MSDPAIPAATLIVVRERDAGPPELLMVERAEGMAFAGGAWVFPGGRIDESDRRLAADTGLNDGAERVAAIRETVEETAIPVGLTPLPDPAEARRMQSALLDDGPFGEMLRGSNLRLDLEALTPLARWVPKFHAARRFDTLFFVAAAPEGAWEPNVVAGECRSAAWVTAAEVLERDQAGEAQLIFPTRRTLERLARHASLADILADARAHAIAPITPWLEEIDGERFVTIPEGIGYPVTREKLDGLWRG